MLGFLPSSFAKARPVNSCVNLFSLPEAADLFSSVEDSSLFSTDEEYTLRRFQKTIERSGAEQLSPLASRWNKKINAPIFPLKNILHINRETHQSLTLSLDEKFVVSRSSTGTFRVLDAKNGEVLSELEDVSTGLDYRTEVLYASNGHFVIGVDHGTSVHRDSSSSTEGFYPHEILLFDLKSKEVAEYRAQGRMKNSSVSPDGRYWLNATQYGFDIIDIATHKMTQNWLGDVHTVNHPENFDQIVNTANFSQDGQKIVVTGGDSRGRRAATLFVFAFRGRESIESIQDIELPFSRVYRTSNVDNQWIAEGTRVGWESHTALEKIEINL